MIRRIDHIGILVRSLAEALPLYTDRLGFSAEPPVELPEHHMRVQFVGMGNDRIELLQPTSPDSALGRVLATRGEGLLHLCLEVDDIETTLRDLERAGVRLVDDHARMTPHGLAAFLHPESVGGISIELRQARDSQNTTGIPSEAPAASGPSLARLSGRTRVVFTLGYPVAQTLSPAMMTAAFQSSGIDWVYLGWSVPPEGLAVAVEALRANENFAAGNVTAPHKETIIPLLDGLTPDAERVGAVNVILREGARFIGHTTDGHGFVASLREEGMEPRGKGVLILGAGGAAKAVGFALADAGVGEIWIGNRTLARAEAVARLIAEQAGAKAHPAALTEVAALLSRVDLVVNATSVGLQRDASPLFDYGLLRPPLFVTDLVFSPRETPFLRQARAQGCQTMNGLGMLLHQAVLNFVRWTGMEAPVPLMRRFLLEALDERERRGKAV